LAKGEKDRIPLFEKEGLGEICIVRHIDTGSQRGLSKKFLWALESVDEQRVFARMFAAEAVVS